MQRFIAILSFLLLLFFTQPAHGINFAEIGKFTDDYLKQYKSGEPSEAFELYWNWDIFCSRAFGSNYTSLKSTEKIKAQQLVFKIFTGIFANPDILAGMKTASFTDQRTTSDQDANIQFSFETIFSDGVSGGRSILFIKEIKNRPWCIDLYKNGLLSDQLRSAYQSNKERKSLLTFLKYFESTAQESISNMTSTASESWIHGTWELTFDPDNGEKDWIVFNKFGSVILKGASGPNFEGYYSVSDNKVTLRFNIKNKVREMEMMILDKKSKLQNSSGAYYTRISE